MGFLSWFKRRDKTKVLESHTIKVMQLLTEAKQLSKAMVKTLAYGNQLNNDVRADSILRERARRMTKILKEAKLLAQETLSLSDVKKLDMGTLNSQMKSLSVQSRPLAELVSKQVRQQSRSIHQAERFIVQSLSNAIEKYQEFENLEFYRKNQWKSNLESYARSIIALYAYTGVVLQNARAMKIEETVAESAQPISDQAIIRAWESAALDLKWLVLRKHPGVEIKAAARNHLREIEAFADKSKNQQINRESRIIISKLTKFNNTLNAYSNSNMEIIESVLVSASLHKSQIGRKAA
ncbi:MAG TPA: hypothetical protein VJH88_04805 [Candidatus Nanoarchaeia archaeon]|nr:hypothetical protein [Candidatus Nanoarchaeia archaeon]